MNYLTNLLFTEDEINIILKTTPAPILDKLLLKKSLILDNLNYLKKLGVNNYKAIFIKHSEIFLQEPSIFQKIFTKYRRDDLIKKLAENIDLIIYL